MLKPGDLVVPSDHVYGLEQKRNGFILGEVLAVESWHDSPDGLLITVSVVLLKGGRHQIGGLIVGNQCKWYGIRVKLAGT